MWPDPGTRRWRGSNGSCCTMHGSANGARCPLRKWPTPWVHAGVPGGMRRLWIPRKVGTIKGMTLTATTTVKPIPAPDRSRRVVTLRVTEAEAQILDALPGDLPVGSYILRMIRHDVCSTRPVPRAAPIARGSSIGRLVVAVPPDLRLAMDLRRGEVALSDYLRGLIRAAKASPKLGKRRRPPRYGRSGHKSPGPGTGRPPDPGGLPPINRPLQPALTRRPPPAGR